VIVPRVPVISATRSSAAPGPARSWPAPGRRAAR